MDTTPDSGPAITEMAERLRSLDPADAPDLADELAEKLAAELEQPGRVEEEH